LRRVRDRSRRNKQFLSLLLASLTLTLLAPTLTPRTEAKVFTGYKYYEEWFLGIHYLWEIWVTINTTAQTWTVKWSGPSLYIIFPYHGLLSYLWRWDDLGFTHKYGPLCIPCLAPSGTWTIPYNNTDTWAYSEFQWMYAIDPFTFIPKTLRLGIYIEDCGENPSQEGGGGGGKVPYMC